MKQSSMFGNDDLPLFSGTAQRVKANGFKSETAHRQETFANCRLCMDFGQVEGRYCICEAGQALRVWHRKAKHLSLDK